MSREEKKILSGRMKKLSPYIPGEQPQDRIYLKLNTNENPYPPTPKIKDFLLSFDTERLRLYPDPLAEGLRKKIAERHGVKKEQVFVSNGSDEALSLCFFTFFDVIRGPLLFPEFTYSFYPVYCDFYGIDYETIPLRDDFAVDLDGVLNHRESCGCIFANPNAPTGVCLSLEKIRRFLESYSPDRAVIIDEAYIDFGGESTVKFTDHYQNLLIVRTFSKSMSLAGLRLGYVIGNEDLIDALFTVKDSFNSYPVDILSQFIGRIALSDVAYYESITSKIMIARDSFFEELTSLGWSVLPSTANFLFARKNGIHGKQIYEKLKERGVLVRHFDVAGIDDFVRITIGTRDEMERLLKELKGM